MATQKDVADLAGVSFITVSRVINNKGNVKPQTRKAVEDAIKKLNYYPNSFAQGLNRNATRTIAILSSIPQRISVEENFYYRRLLVGIEYSCMAEGFDMLLSAQRGLNKDFDYLRPYYERRADGIILLGTHPNDEQIRRIQSEDIPCVLIGDRNGGDVISYVDTQNYEGAQEAFKRLFDLGHRDFGFLNVSRWTQNVEDRFNGFKAALENAGLSLRPECLLTGDFTKESGAKALEDWLACKKRPTALICATDLMALGVHERAKSLGVRIPEDLSILGFDGHEIASYVSPALSTMAQPLEEMGEQAALILLQKISGKIKDPEHVLKPLHFVAGASIAAFVNK